MSEARDLVNAALGERQPPRTFKLTDLGNAERLVHEHGRDLRFAPGLGWFAWDGKRWRPDSDGEAIRRAKKTVRSMYAQAEALDDPEERKRQAVWAIKSESAARLKAAVELAQTELPVIVRPEELDADPLLFNAQNGTIDLRTGELREHRREDLLTKLGGAVYDPDARSELWERVVERATGHGDDLGGFLQRAVGYSLTGYTTEEVLLFLHGPTNTAKSTIAEALKAMFGEYGMTADFESFLKRRGDAGIRNDIARLVGARLVVSVEVDEGKALAEGLLKVLTGGDTVAARFMYQEFFEYVPQFKLWLAANERPRVRAEDAALWRRILQVPLTQQIPDAERDERVKIELRSNPEVRAAILAWAVQGCLDWQRQGLAVPACVRDYTDDYRKEHDRVGEWIEACCILEPALTTSARELRGSYDSWCQENAEGPVSNAEYGRGLRARGCIPAQSGSTKMWSGIGVLDKL